MIGLLGVVISSLRRQQDLVRENDEAAWLMIYELQHENQRLKFALQDATLRASDLRKLLDMRDAA